VLSVVTDGIGLHHPLEMKAFMEGASGHNDLSNTRRGVSTPWRETNQLKDVPHATAWSRQIRHCSPRSGVGNCIILARPRRGEKTSPDWILHAVAWRTVSDLSGTSFDCGGASTPRRGAFHRNSPLLGSTQIDYSDCSHCTTLYWFGLIHFTTVSAR